MNHIVRKAYWDYEKEEIWLNEMSARGLALTGYSWCRYVFKEASENEYIYRIELLPHRPSHPESIAYLKFLEDSGIECVASYMRWVYLRKKSAEGQFDIYTDIDSKIKHYRRISVFWSALIWLEALIGLLNIIIGIINLNWSDESGNFPVVNIVEGSILLLLGLLIYFYLYFPVRKKMRRLKREKTIRE